VDEAELVAAIEEGLDEQIYVHVDVADHHVESHGNEEFITFVVLAALARAFLRQNDATPDACAKDRRRVHGQSAHMHENSVVEALRL